MKIVVVGSRGPVVDAAAAAFSSRDGVDFGRVKTLDQAVEIAEGAKDAVVLYPVEKASEKAFEGLKGREAKVLVLGPANPAVRALAFSAGAWDVVFPPHDAPRMESAVELALGRPLRKWRRCPVPIPADILLPDGAKHEGRVMNMSLGGAQVLLREAFRTESGAVR
ncbi:MAG TPA: PilZ domain-containing protein, partial [bacterium]|nr:PilZ domain-containing protein [bacterium]